MGSWSRRGAPGVALAVVCAITLGGACKDDRDKPAPSGSGSTGSGQGGIGPECEHGEIDECKVQIDDINCFVGEKKCDEETSRWGDCLEKGTFSETGFHTNAIGMQNDCLSNPC